MFLKLGEVGEIAIPDKSRIGYGVTIPDTNSKIIRNFTVTGHYHTIYKKYANLRPRNVNGLNKLGDLGKEIAKYLQFTNHELYTGHCFDQPSKTILVDAGGDITTLKRHGGWKSTAAAERYIEESKKNKLNMANKITNAIVFGAEEFNLYWQLSPRTKENFN
ncbi:hypothetical protein NQ317_013449 [Molorchus minor]|uniref:Tyr recombinase domain-containing protein n=1 Tax=Molorchus minor TaxID=1323400 RepID=A0ABQ9J635_9CUCU|nr:hypothetical protein NQ317_013449 [Molorchus minor]